MTKTSSRHATQDLALISIFAAFIAVCALLPAFPLGPAGVPLTFQTLGIYITSLVLGGRRAGLATLLYLVVGLLGLPIFAGGGAGPAVLAMPAAGYLLGFPLGAFLAGWLAYRGRRSFPQPGKAQWVSQLLAVLAGFMLITATGVLGMMLNAGLSLTAACLAAAIYLPGDLIKSIIAIFISQAVHRAFPQLAEK
ncbi:MAG: biotin transporter BioY [Rothia sp. (in: high G+C Gram-positive bacteria)]|nr:biotin transporter BioY [Rothia sp. (in: high G+C Gram-positive bacteria)]